MEDPMQDGNNWGWQTAATSIKERTTYLWKNNPIPFNVTFAVGPDGQKELIGAHKDILAISSEVFYAMFYGLLAKPRDPNDPIVDEDIDPEAFRSMLKFIYTESISYDDESRYRTEPFPTGVELAFKTMQVAGKYGIRALYLFCRDYILSDIQNTFTTSEGVAEYGILYALYARNKEWTNKPIVEAVWREIDAFTDAVLQVSDQVLQTVDETFMVEFLSRTSLNVSKEIMLYNFAVRWARLQQKGPRKGEKLKDVMEKLGEVLRFSSMSEQEWRDGPVEDGVYALRELKRKAALAGYTTSRSAHDPPAIIGFEMYEGKEKYQGQYVRVDDLGHIEIQTGTEGNQVLTELVERCIRKQMKRNGSDSPISLSVAFLYKGYDLECVGWGSFDIGDELHLNKEELNMLSNGGRIAAQMKLGPGDVATGFVLASEHGGAEDKLGNMYLVFGDDSGKKYSKYWHDVDVARLFYLGRLITGQDYLDDWAKNPYSRTVFYDVTYEKKTLDAPVLVEKIPSDVNSDKSSDTSTRVVRFFEFAILSASFSEYLAVKIHMLLHR